jgi:hypothetical protein
MTVTDSNEMNLAPLAELLIWLDAQGNEGPERATALRKRQVPALQGTYLPSRGVYQLLFHGSSPNPVQGDDRRAVGEARILETSSTRKEKRCRAKT